MRTWRSLKRKKWVCLQARQKISPSQTELKRRNLLWLSKTKQTQPPASLFRPGISPRCPNPTTPILLFFIFSTIYKYKPWYVFFEKWICEKFVRSRTVYLCWWPRWAWVQSIEPTICKTSGNVVNSNNWSTPSCFALTDLNFFDFLPNMPPKKKKSGKKKLAKMTEEERLLYMEQKRLAEEEMRKKKEDMLTQFLKVMTKRQTLFCQI